MEKGKNITFLNELMDKPIRKMLAFLILMVFSTNIFSTAIDPVSLNNARMTRTATGIEQLDIATPNANGTSYNSLKELQVSEQGLIINNNPHIITDTKIAGMVVRNRNLDNGIAANLIITEVTGKNRTNINGYVEIAGSRADLVMANRNGITVNGGGFLNSDRVTLTTGNLNMENGNLVAIDVAQSDITIGEKGIDALSLADLEFISKTINIDGIIKASNETKILISTGGQTYQYKTKEVKSKGETYKGIAVDGKSAGSMYAGKIDILSNDKGAGVNTKGDLVSVDDITITASGDITTNKVATNKTVKYNTNKTVKIKGETKAGKKVAVKSNKTEIDAKVITGFLEESLGKNAFEVDTNKMTVSSSGNVEAYGKTSIKSKLTENKGEIYSTEKIDVSGQKLDNTNGTIRSNGNINLDVSETENIKGYILSDGLTKEEVDNDKNNQNSDSNNTNIENIEYGINILGSVNNTNGVIKGRNISIGGNVSNDSGIINSIMETKLHSDILSNRQGSIITSGRLELNGNKINNEKGLIRGDIEKLNKEQIINDNGQLISLGKIEGVVKNLSNEKGELFGDSGVKLVSNNINNLAGLIRSNGKVELDNKSLINNDGYILSDGLTKEEVDNWAKAKMREKIDDSNTSVNDKNIGNNGISITSDRLENTKGIIASLTSTELNVGNISNKQGSIISKGVVELTIDNDYVYDGIVEGDVATRIKGNIITINDNIKRNNTLELIGNNGLILKENILAKVLKLETEKNLENEKEIKGSEALILKGDNITNKGNILSDDYLELVAKNKLTNEEIGTIKGIGSTYLEAKSIYNNRGNILSNNDLVLISDMLIKNNSGVIKSGESVYAEVKNGNLENLNSGTIESNELRIKANNIYNTQSYTQDEINSNTISLGRGSKIIGDNVYLEALDKVVNGTEEYTNGTYRREDGVLVDNRQVNSEDASLIAGNNSTTIKAGSLINTSSIGIDGIGQMYIEAKNRVVNASIGSNIAKIIGNEVYINGKDEVSNIGGQIKGNNRTQVISENGKVLNESTISHSEDTKLLTESIRNIGKIESNEIVYVQGKDIENIASNIQGEQGTYLEADNDVEDRTIILKYKGDDIVENDVNWNELERNTTVSGILGLGGNTIIESGNDIILESSNLRASEDIVMNAKNYILMLSTVDTEYKYRTETHKRGGKLRRKKITTNTWIEDNAYANGVDITTNGNVLMNYKGVGVAADNKGIFAQGVNFNAGGQIYGVSDGNIYIQGTKDILNSVFDSKTTKSFFGLKYSKKSDYISENKEKYKLSQLYGNAGITVDAEGKLKVEGADILSEGNIFLRGKLGTEILPGTEAYSRYEEHKRTGFNGSLVGLLSGIEKTSIEKRKEEIIKDKITNVGTKINSNNGKIDILGDTVYIQGAKIGAKDTIVLDGRNGVVVEDALNYEKNEHNIENIKIGLTGPSGSSIDRKNLGARIGIKSTYELNDLKQAYLYPERSILVSDRSVYVKSNDGNIYFQGDAGAVKNIVMMSENGNIYIKDSQSKINEDNKTINGEVFFGLTGNVGGIKETLKSYKDYINTIKALRDTGKVLRLIKDIVKGEDIYEALEGREDAVNALNTYFKGPSSGGVSGGISVEAKFDYSKGVSEYIRNLTTNIRAGENIVLKANNLDFYGGNIESGKDTILEAKSININASEDKYKDKFQNVAFSGQYTIYGTRGGGGSVNFAKGEREGSTFNNTQITAGDTLYAKSDDLIIKGGNLRGRITDVKTQNLVLESIQDIEKYRELGAGVSVSVSKSNNVSQGSKAKGAGNGGVSGVVQNKEWVENQSSITGSEKLVLSAEDAYIKGGLIANIDENGNDNGNLNVNITRLTVEDIQNKDKKASVGIRAGFSQRNEVPTYDQVYVKDTNGKYIPTGNKTGASFGMSLGGFDKEKITRATIGSGVLTVGEINGELNRYISRADEITKDKNVSTINMDYSNMNKKWGQIGEIMATHAGSIGTIVDDLSQQVFGASNKNYSEKWSGTVYKGYRKVEDFIDRKLYNDKIPIIPTSGQHGGVLEGIEKFFTKDKFPIYNLTLTNVNGKTIITGNKVNSVSEVTNTETLLNGMTEESETSIANTINQLLSRKKEMRDKLENGQSVNLTLIYSPTRGNWVDAIESALGKLFDGSGLDRLTLGTSRGFADILLQLDSNNQKYNLTLYSQANIITLGALNNLKNRGIKLNNNITIYHTGTPTNPTAFDKLEDTVGFKNGVSLINREDPVGSVQGKIAGTKGLISETRDYNAKESGWTVWKKYFRWVPILRSALSEGVYPVLDTPHIKEFEVNRRYGEYKEEIMLVNNLKNDKEFEKFINNYHGWYNIDDREYVKNMLELSEKYQKANDEQKKNIINSIENIRQKRMDEMVEGWRLGFLVGIEDIKEFRTEKLYEEYKNNRRGEWQENYGIIQAPNINREIAIYRYNKEMAKSFDDYIERLKNEVK